MRGHLLVPSNDSFSYGSELKNQPHKISGHPCTWYPTNDPLCAYFPALSRRLTFNYACLSGVLGVPVVYVETLLWNSIRRGMFGLRQDEEYGVDLIVQPTERNILPRSWNVFENVPTFRVMFWMVTDNIRRVDFNLFAV